MVDAGDPLNVLALSPAPENGLLSLGSNVRQTERTLLK